MAVAQLIHQGLVAQVAEQLEPLELMAAEVQQAGVVLKVQVEQQELDLDHQQQGHHFREETAEDQMALVAVAAVVISVVAVAADQTLEVAVVVAVLATSAA